MFVTTFSSARARGVEAGPEGWARRALAHAAEKAIAKSAKVKVEHNLF